jgi:hypothetical protein
MILRNDLDDKEKNEVTNEENPVENDQASAKDSSRDDEPQAKPIASLTTNDDPDEDDD